MARSTSNTAAQSPILPRGATEFLWRRLTEGAGLGLLALALMLLGALLSFNPSDPSLNTAGKGALTNWLGLPGAYVSDFLLQAVGLAAAAPVLVLAAWGLRLIGKRRISLLWLRVVLMLGAALLLAIALAAITVPPEWPLRSGLGGVAGSMMLKRIAALLALLSIKSVPALWIIWAFAATAGLAGLSILFFALGLSRQDWSAMGRDAAGAATVVAGGAKTVAGFGWRSLGALKLQWDSHADHRREPSLNETEPDDIAQPEPVELHAEPELTRPKPARKAEKIRQRALDLQPAGEYRLPPIDLLKDIERNRRAATISEDALKQNARLLESVLDDFGVRGQIVKVRPGPVVTLYELEPTPGTKASRVIGLAEDIARSMSAVSARIAVIPGRNVIGIELPNQQRETVHLRELLEAEAFERAGGKLNLMLGKDIGGTPVIVDLTRMPHLLIAGTTGSGKSVAINTMILSLLFRLTPDECRFIMIDPKMLELSVYDGIPHLLAPVVTEPGKAIVALKWVVREMEDRYRAMSQLGVRNIAGYNARLEEARKKNETLSRRVQTGFDEDGKPVFEDVPLATDPLPFIVVVVDEMADLMLVAGKDIEAAVQRLAQMARAAGIHLIMATQRPSVDVITGTIKANFPTRISFQVTSKIDSRTILGEQGAEQLLGQGDMLYMAGGGRTSRVHGPFVSDEEVEKVVRHMKRQGQPAYIEAITEEPEEAMGPMGGGGEGGESDRLYDEAVALVARERKASTSFIQRHLQIGYNRAARIIERMEAEGVVSKANRVGRREVLAGEV